MWIESHQELGRHPKTKKFARLTGISLPAAVGHLHYLWWWAMDYARNDGNLSKYDADDIADAVLWTGDANELLNCLIKSGFVDDTSDGLVIHDWMQYIGKLLEKLATDAERKRKSRDKNKMSDGCPADVHVTAQVTIPNQPNQPNLTNSNSISKTTKENKELESGKRGDDLPHAGEPAAVKSIPIPFEQIKQMYNEICVSLPKIQVIDGERRKAVAARYKTYGGDLEIFRILFEKSEASDFMKGANNRNWSADFDWITKPTNMAKILEGKYDNRINQPRAPSDGSDIAAMLNEIEAEKERSGTLEDTGEG